MQRFNQWLAGPRVLLLAVAAWVFVLPALPARATPVNMYFDGTSTVGGFDAASVSAFQTAGGQTLSPTPLLFDNSQGTRISISTPAAAAPGAGSNTYTKTNPFVRTIQWTATAKDQSYSNLWIVFATQDPNDPFPYTTSDIGIQADSLSSTNTYRLLQPLPGTYYLAIYLGDLQQNASVSFGLTYVVGQSLFAQSGTLNYELPQLSYGFTEAPLPEPGSLVLLAVGVLGALAARRRSC